MNRDALQRVHNLREVLNGLRRMVRPGATSRTVPGDPPPCHTIYRPTQRWRWADAFEAIVRDLGVLLWEMEGLTPQATATLLYSRTVRSSLEINGVRAMTGPSAGKALSARGMVWQACTTRAGRALDPQSYARHPSRGRHRILRVLRGSSSWGLLLLPAPNVTAPIGAQRGRCLSQRSG